MALDNAYLINNHGKLLEAARKKVHEYGFQYKKNASRSKSFGMGATSSSSTSASKRPRYSTELRGKRISKVKEDLKDLSTRILYAEKSQKNLAMFSNLMPPHQYAKKYQI